MHYKSRDGESRDQHMINIQIYPEGFNYYKPKSLT
jgi:hypothetical protein